MAVVANFPEDSLAIHLLLEASESLLNGLALLQFDLGHAASLPFRTLVGVTNFLGDDGSHSGQNGVAA